MFWGRESETLIGRIVARKVTVRGRNGPRRGRYTTRMESSSRTGRVVALLMLIPGLMLGLAPGCSSSSSEPEPLSRMLDQEALTKTRIRAINRVWDAVEAGEVERPQAREMLKRVAWSRSTFWSTRVAAIDALLEDTQGLDDTQAMFALLVPTEKVAEVLERIGEISVERGWVNVAPSFVRAWDRNTQDVRIDDDRPEPKTLIAMFPDRSLTETLFEVFRGSYQDGPGVRFGEKDRRAAWGLLVRSASSDEQVTALVRRASSVDRDADPLMWAVVRAADRFHAVPKTAEQVAWVERLFTDPANSEFVAAAERSIATLNAEQRTGWELRHIAPVVWSARFEPGLMSSTRDQLLTRLERELEGRESFERDRTDTAWLGGESLEEWKNELVWADALALLIASRVVETPTWSVRETHARLFEQADADHADTSTEYGGVVVWSESGVPRFDLFPPRVNSRFGDDRFVASQELIEASDTALFHYHFHAMRTRNADYAGPSFNDFEYVRREGRSSLLLTFVSADRLNIDYFQPDGLRIDLGTIDRP